MWLSFKENHRRKCFFGSACTTGKGRFAGSALILSLHCIGTKQWDKIGYDATIRVMPLYVIQTILTERYLPRYHVVEAAEVVV